MAERRMTVEEAQAKLPELLEGVRGGGRVVIEDGHQGDAFILVPDDSPEPGAMASAAAELAAAVEELGGLGDEFADMMERIVEERHRERPRPVSL